MHDQAVDQGTDAGAEVTGLGPADPRREPLTEPIGPLSGPGTNPAANPAAGSVTGPAAGPTAGPATSPANGAASPPVSAAVSGSLAEPATEPIPAQHESPPADPPPAPRGWEALRGAVRDHAAFAIVLLVVAVGGIRMLEYHWRQGSALIGGALILAALFRALLPDERAGLLVVRGRSIDVLSYTGLGAVTLWVALTLTGGPFG